MSLFSVNTNVGALAALQSLDTTQQQLTSTQAQISTGQKVGSASDNPAIYAIANTINSNIAGLSAVSDSLNFGAQVVAVASSATTNVNTVLQSLQQTVTTANQSGVNLTTLQNQVNAELTSISTYASAATFNGVNLLSGSTGSNGITANTLNVVQSVDGSVYNVANQINPTGGATNSNLLDALGLTGLNVDTGSGAASVGANISFGNATTVANTFPSSGSDAALQLTLGSGGTAKTLTFEFVDDNNSGGTQLQSQPSATNNVVAVHFNSTTDSTNKILGDLSTALTQNGLGVVQQSDGSLNVVGKGLSAADFGTVASGTFSTGSATTFTAGVGGSTNSAPTSGVTVTGLATEATTVTTVQAAVANLNTISAGLGAASQQITGIQNFTTALSSALTAGVGALTDADLAAESAKLTSLQTKQQLATQALSIANQQPQSLLSLFKG